MNKKALISAGGCHWRTSGAAALLAVLALIGTGAYAADGVDDMIKMSRSGVSADVLLAYVQDTDLTYDLSADEIQTLQESGVPSNVIVAMLDKGKDAAPLAAADASVADAQPVTVGAPPAETADASATIVAPPADDANISYFYQALAPDGRWQQDESLGWVWQPTVVVEHTDWRPYCNDGHWVWTDQGWYFENDYRWGWAAFHYGRWHQHDRLGWVWAPDTEWAPAWVSWRQNDSYYGWAPLPPDTHFDAESGFSFHSKRVGFNFDFGLRERDYTFVPSDRFLDGNLAVVAIRSDRSRTVFEQTTLVNNTYVYNDNRVVNNGVSVRDVGQRTKRKIETVKLADAQIKAGEAVRGEARNQNTLAVYRPKIAKAAPKTPPAAIAHNTYVKHDGRAAQATAQNGGQPAGRTPARAPVNTMTDTAAKARLAQEVEKRRSGAAARTNTAAVKKEDADQKRLDAELKQREARDARSTNAVEKKDEAEQRRLEAETKQREAKDARVESQNEAKQSREQAAQQREQALEAQKEKAVQQRDQAAQQRETEAKVREQAKAEATQQREQAQQAQQAQKEQAVQQRNQAAQQRETEAKVREQAKAEAAQQRQQERAKPEPAPRAPAPAVEPAPKAAPAPAPAPKADARAERVQEREQAAEQRRTDAEAKRQEQADERAAKREEKK